jgi:hypothetical protein
MVSVWECGYTWSAPPAVNGADRFTYMRRTDMSILDTKILAILEKLDTTRQQQLLDYAAQQVEAQRAEQRV